MDGDERGFAADAVAALAALSEMGAAGAGAAGAAVRWCMTKCGNG